MAQSIGPEFFHDTYFQTDMIMSKMPPWIFDPWTWRKAKIGEIIRGSSCTNRLSTSLARLDTRYKGTYVKAHEGA